MGCHNGLVDIFAWIFGDLARWVGIGFVGFVVGFIGLYFVAQLGRRFVAELKPGINDEEMPVLRPVPIPTKGTWFGRRILIWLFEDRQWDLVNEWTCTLPGGETIKIEKGYRFDGASIPRPLRFLLSPTGLLLIPALVHDHGYEKRYVELVGGQRLGENYKRRDWDRLFRRHANAVNGTPVIDFLAWLAVRIGGWVVWRKHRP